MFNLNEEFITANKNAVDTALRFAQLALTSTERLMKLQMDAVRTGLEEKAKTAKATVEIKDVKELTAMGRKLAERFVERATNYSREVYEIANEAQSEMTNITEANLKAAADTVAKNIKAAAKKPA